MISNRVRETKVWVRPHPTNQEVVFVSWTDYPDDFKDAAKNAVKLTSFNRDTGEWTMLRVHLETLYRFASKYGAIINSELIEAKSTELPMPPVPSFKPTPTVINAEPNIEEMLKKAKEEAREEGRRLGRSEVLESLQYVVNQYQGS